MRRSIVALSAIALLAVTSTAHAGGMNPGIPNTVKIGGPTINGIMVVDTHNYGVTTMSPPDVSQPEFKSLVTAIWLQRGGITSSAIFMLPSTFLANFGCDPSRTSARFAYTASHANLLNVWMRPDTLATLLSQLGVNPAVAGQPIITTISNNVCTDDPENPSPTNGIGIDPNKPAPGILSFEFNIQFIRP